MKYNQEEINQKKLDLGDGYLSWGLSVTIDNLLDMYQAYIICYAKSDDIESLKDKMLDVRRTVKLLCELQELREQELKLRIEEIKSNAVTQISEN